MALVLVATSTGCRLFGGGGDAQVELPGRAVSAIAHDTAGGLLAIVDQKQIWRRSADAQWSHVASSDLALECIASVNGTILAGSSEGAVMVQVTPGNQVQRVTGFDRVPGRDQWVGHGPPLQVRALTATADGAVILAAVHVGGISRSTDGGNTWAQTVPMNYDVHEVRAHPSSPLVAAAAAVGLCVSPDGGRNWNVLADGLEGTSSLALAVLPDEVLFSIQDGPFAQRSQIWRWRIDGRGIEPVQQGLPPWLKGKVDTAHIAANKGQAAFVDGGGDLWLSAAGSTGWQRIATGLQDAFGVQIL